MKSLLLTLTFCLACIYPFAQAGESTHKHHDHKHHHHEKLDVSELKEVPTLELKVVKDAAKGWNVQLVTENFRFAPEHVNQDHIKGEGHAHLYINDKKIRLYSHWFHLGELPKGENIIRATLNANTHAELALGDKLIADSVTIEVD